jgi:hypothetical protein
MMERNSPTNLIIVLINARIGIHDSQSHPQYTQDDGEVLIESSHDMLHSIGNDDIYVFQARASVKPKGNWRRESKVAVSNDRVWLVGDAIHPMLPAR